MLDEILETWQINHRVNLMLLDNISEEGLRCTLSSRGGRDVGRQFAHMHDNRYYWLEAHSKGLHKALKKFASKESPLKETPSKDELFHAHEASGKAIGEALKWSVENGKVKGWKRGGAITALGYLIAHESHHRGSILLTLKQCGHKVDQKIAYGIWDWSRI